NINQRDNFICTFNHFFNCHNLIIQQYYIEYILKSIKIVIQAVSYLLSQIQMILFTILSFVLSEQIVEIDKTIYLTQGEDYKVNLDSIFNENLENTYSFVSQSKGFILDSSNLKLKSDQGIYSIKPSKILRQRQLINLEDYQGKGQFGVLDQYDTGHRICYNSDSSIDLNQCIELDDTADSYDFVFIEKDTIAVSKIRVSDKQFGVTIYQNKEIINELYFLPSKTYTNIGSTIIEYCQFQSKNYVLFGVTEVVDSNIEFLEIKTNFQITNTNNFIEKSLLPIGDNLQVLHIKGSINKALIAVKQQNTQLILTFYYKNSWTCDDSLQFATYLRAIDLGYNIIEQKLTFSILECEQDFYRVRSLDGPFYFTNLLKGIKNTAQVKYTLNYLIISQDNVLSISTLYKLTQRSHNIEGTILSIDVDFQNDIVFVFTDTKILTYYLKPAILAFSSNFVTDTLDLVTIKAVAGDVSQFANIHFQVLAKDDYTLHQLSSLTKDLYYNRGFQSPNNNVPTNGMSGPDIRVSAKADNQVKITSHNIDEYGLEISQIEQKQPIYEQFVSNYYNPFLFRQFEDLSFQIYDCRFNNNKYQCSSTINISDVKQKVTVSSSQIGQSRPQYALLGFDHLKIYIYTGSNLNSIITAEGTIIFGTMAVGVDRLFTYTVNDEIGYYYFPSGQLITKLKLSQFGKPTGTISRNLWLNQAKTNLLVLSFGDELLIFRFTSEFILIQRLAIKLVQDVAILSDDKMIIFHTEGEIDILTQYQLSDGQFKIQKEIDTHGFQITGFELYKDYGNAKIIIQAQKDQQKALLVYGDTELARDSLLKVIPLKEDETGIMVIQNQQVSSLLKRKIGDKTYNSTVIDISYLYQVIEINQGEIHNKFSQELDLTYSFSNYFSQDTFQVIKHLFLEYQFYNLTAKENPNNTISYKKENELQIPIKQDTFQGQVRNYLISPNDEHLKLTTRFKNSQAIDGIPKQSVCKYLTSFQRILCINGLSVTYHDQNGKQLSEVSLISLSTSPLKQFVLHNDEKYALVISSGQLMLIYFLENEIKNSMAYYQWTSKIDVSIFYLGWFVIQEQNYLRYYQFSAQNNDQWSLEKKYEYFIYGISGIQYDTHTKQIFYQTGYDELYYFESSLEGTVIDKQTVYSINLAAFLQTQKIYQIGTRITNIQIKDYGQKSFIFVSTSCGNILNMTIKSITEQFSVNSLYIANGGYDVRDIQQIDDYVLIQIGNYQLLYKNTNNWQLDSPYLSLEGIAAQNFLALYKNGSQIVHLYQNQDDQNFYQANIDDNIYLTINNLKTYKPGNIQIGAYNGYGEARTDFKTIQLRDEESSSNSWIWITAGVIAVVAILVGGFYCYKRRQSVDPLLGFNLIKNYHNLYLVVILNSVKK
ncbi:hypothetical protein pb186bvf_014775, partial [Paramecium bursaria]